MTQTNLDRAAHASAAGYRIRRPEIDDAAEIGSVHLAVLVANGRAQACYRRYGFVDEGNRQHHDLFNTELMLMTRD